MKPRKPTFTVSALITGAVALVSVLAMSGVRAQVAVPEIVETAPLATDAFSTGTIERGGGALPETLWDGSDPQTLEFLLMHAPSRLSSPSQGEVLRRTLLSRGQAPASAQSSLGGRKLIALARTGMVEEARTIASLSSAGRNDPWVGQALATADLLGGDIAAACRRNANLTSGRDEVFWVKLRVLCFAQAGEIDAADLTLNILREQGSLSAADVVYLRSSVTKTAPTVQPSVETALHYAITKSLGLPLSQGLMSNADAGVLMATAKDETADLASRIWASEQTVAMGIAPVEQLASIMTAASFDVAEVAETPAALRDRAGNPLTDALVYQSVAAMAAPEFLRDKAGRIAAGISIAESFPRAFALSMLYADEINAMEGVLVTPNEALSFATARMAAGDSVGAGRWMQAALGSNPNVGALPQPVASAFIDQVNLLAVLDPQLRRRLRARRVFHSYHRRLSVPGMGARRRRIQPRWRA